MWASDEPFGWATYHYGRWGFSDQVGWFWVPGSRWAPAWVSWLSSDNYLAWAPLPPAYDEDLSINIQVESVPDYYWQVVPVEAFVSADLPRYIVRDEQRYDPILQQTRPLGNVAINNNVVVNNVVNVTYVEQKTNQKVIVHQVDKTADANNAGKIEGAAVEVFQPAPEQVPKKVAAPPQPKKIEDVAAETKTKEQGVGKPSTDELLIPPEIKKPAGDAASPPPPPLPPEGYNSKGSRRQTEKGQRRASTRGASGYAARHGTTTTAQRGSRSSAERSRRQTEEGQGRTSTRGSSGYAARHGTTPTPARRGRSSAERPRRQTEESQGRTSTRGASGYAAWDGTTTAAGRGRSSAERSRRQTEEGQGRTSTPRRSCYAA
jgi:hypothetical protein